MGECRLEGLLLMEIHKRIHVDAAAVVKMYVPQEERHLHPLKVKQREVGYRACWLDAQAGPAWRNRPPASRARGRRCTYRDLAHRVGTLYCEGIPIPYGAAVISLQKALTLLQTGQDSERGRGGR